VNNRRFSEFFDRYFHIPLPIVTKHELGLAFPPRNLPIKFGTNSSTIFFIILVTDRHTNQRQLKHIPSLSRGEKFTIYSWDTALFPKQYKSFKSIKIETVLLWNIKPEGAELRDWYFGNSNGRQ